MNYLQKIQYKYSMDKRNKKRMAVFTSLLLIVSLTFVLITTIDLFPVMSRIISLALLILISLVYPYIFGNKGLIPTYIFCIYGLFTSYENYYSENSNLWFLLSFLIITIMIAALIIAVLISKDRKVELIYEKFSNIDNLTETYNHTYFHTRLNEEISRAHRSKTDIVLFFIDLYKFKDYNKKYGYKEGDRALIETAKILRNSLRIQDIIFRYSGDVFAVILPDTDKNTGINAAERLCAGFKRKALNISIGISLYPESANNVEELISQADNALFHAKHETMNSYKLYTDIFDEIKDSISIENINSLDSLRSLLCKVAVKDKYSYCHAERVSIYASKLGEALGLNEKQTKLLKIEGLLYDIGKIDIPAEILCKKEKLTREEFAIIMKHPIHSANIIISITGMNEAVEGVKHHHERFDGTGYPDNKSGTEIPLFSRILSIADSFDAMLSKKPYRKPMNLESAEKELIKNSGKQFDPELVDVFLQLLKGDKTIRQLVDSRA